MTLETSRHGASRNGEGCAVGDVALRPVDDADLDAIFDNVRSLKVLQAAGFAVVGTEIDFANGRNAEIEETILRLD
jgi:hypothetical protein